VVGTLRFRSKPFIALSIVLVLASALGGWHAPDDADQYASAAVHQHADHDARLSAASQPTAPEHCALCHWLRAFGSGSPIATQIFAAQEVGFLAAGEGDDFVRAASQLILPSRAPPLV
jgi:hypothetical protein